jgi:AraC family transcriptional activator of pobA
MYKNLTNYKNAIDVRIDSSIEINNATQYTIVWIEKEVSFCLLNFEEVKVNPNTILMLNPGEVYSMTSEEKDAFTIINIQQLPDAILKIYFSTQIANNNFNNVIIEFKTEEVNQTRQLIKTITELSSKEDDEWQMEYTLNALLLKVINARIRKQYMTTLAFNELVSNYYKTEHLVVAYADKLKISPKQLLLKLCKQGVNKPHNIIKKRLMQEAKKLLVLTNKPIKEICYEMGFDDPAYFARFFKKNAGMTALKFRKIFNNKKEKCPSS